MRISLDTETIPKENYDVDYFLSKKFYLEKNLNYKASLMTEAEKEKLICSTSWVLSQVICICGKIVINDKVEEFKLYSKDEKKLLEAFINNIVNKYKDFLWVHYNGLIFDVPLILKKSIEHSIKIENNNFKDLKKFSKYPHYDCCSWLGGWGLENIQLDLACRQFGIETPKDKKLDYSNIKDAPAELVINQCMGDANAVDKLYLKMKNVL